jgi:hypothetical protein
MSDSMNRTTALERLKDERDYEDELVQRLDEYIISRLDSLPDVTDKERERIRKDIETIIHDSIRHAYLFRDLMQTVIEDDEGQF